MTPKTAGVDRARDLIREVAEQVERDGWCPDILREFNFNKVSESWRAWHPVLFAAH